jgi:hypothetical protein
MLIGFIFWYKGLATGAVADGQLQLLQPFFGLGLAAALLHETVSHDDAGRDTGRDSVRCRFAQIWQLACIALVARKSRVAA